MKLFQVLNLKVLFSILFLFHSIESNSQKKNPHISTRLNNFDPSITQREIQNQLDSIQFLKNKHRSLFHAILGDYYLHFGKLLKASTHYYQAIEMVKKNDPTPFFDLTSCRAYNGLGLLYSKTYQNKIALDYYKKAANILKSKPKFSLQYSGIYGNIANLFARENLKDSCLFYLKKSVLISKKNNFIPYETYALYLDHFPNMDSVSSYIHYLNKFNYDTLYTRASFQIRRSLVSFYLKQKSLNKVDSILNINLNYIKNSKISTTDSLLTLTNKGIYYILSDSLDTGIKTITNKLPLLQKEKKFNELKHLYTILEKAQLSQKDYKATYLTRIQSDKNDSLFQIHKKLKREKGLSIYNAHLKNLQEQKVIVQKQNSLYTFIIVSLVFSLLCGYFFYYRKKNKHAAILSNIKKQKTTLEHQVTSLSNEQQQSHQTLLFKALLLDEKRSFLNELTHTLKQFIQTATSKREKDQLQSIYKQIHLNLKTTSSTEFEYYFEKVHPNFFKVLQLNHPNLTKKEIRLAAFIKLNLDTKEIAEITKNTPTAINTAKSRLKSKLEIETKSSLHNFIQNIK